MKIAIIGSGYVGLVTGACLSEVGINVVCVDVDQQKIDNLQQGIIPIYEPGLESMIKRNMSKGRLEFKSDVASAVKASEVVFISVGTPPDEDGSADLKHVISVARDCGRYMDDYTLVVTKSTVPVGTSLKVRQAINEELQARGATIDFDVASNPEFLKECCKCHVGHQNQLHKRYCKLM
jgi:UDPglucose 6-dehydrogenase